MRSTEKLLDILAQRDLLPEKVLASLRRQVAKSAKPIPPEAVARGLIDAGHLTPALAKRLLAALPESEPGAAEKTPRQPDRRKEKAVQSTPTEAPDDDLGLAPLDDAPRTRASAPKAAEKPAKAPSASPQQRPKQSAPDQPKQAEPASPSGSLLDEELPPLGASGGGLGPLDNLMAAEGMDAAAAGSPLMPLPSKRRGPLGWLKRRRRQPVATRRENVWESPALLLSGGLLLGLLILGAVLLWALGRQSGDEVLAAANEQYRAGSYTQAIHQFDQYLNSFPRHQGVSGARVRRGLAQLRQETMPGADWPRALASAQQVLKEIAPEDAFGEAAAELAAILPAIAEGLATRAQESNDPELLRQAREALELASNRMIVPARLQPTAKLDEVEAQLALVDRQIHQETALDAAVTAIEKALSEGAPPVAYDIRHDLLRTYPALADDPKLLVATRTISAAQQAAVHVSKEAIQPEKGPPPSNVLATWTLAERATKESVSGVEGEVVVAVVAGAAYGFSAVDGRLLWQQHVGESPDGLRAPPVPVAAATAAGSDVFVVAPAAGELWRLDVQSGVPRWRLPLGEPVDVPPVLAEGQVIVATRGGRLHLIDADKGTSVRQIQLPQPVPVAPAVDPRRRLIYQAADHSNLFVLDLSSGQCHGVVHLGHAPGSLSAPPVLAGGLLLLPLNDRARTAVLRVYRVAEPVPAGEPDQGPDETPAQPFLQALQEFRVRGQFDTPPAVAGRTIAAITDLGAAYAFELSAADPQEPLVPLVQRETTDTAPLVRYGLFQGGQLFLADDRLTKFHLRAAEGRLTPQWVSDERSAFLQTPRAVGDAVFHVRRREGEPGAIVAAVHVADGRTLWQNRIAVPPADRPMVAADGRRVVSVSATGSMFQIDADSVRGEIAFDEPSLTTAMFRRPVTSALDLGAGDVALSAGPGSDQLAVYAPGEQKDGYLWRRLPGALTAPPLPYRNGVLVPCIPGHVFFLHPQTGHALAEPFQPPLAPQSPLDWRLPAVGEDGHVAVTDGRASLFALALEPNPKPHWKALAKVELAQPIVAPLAAAGNMVFAVDGSGAVTAYELPDLARRNGWSLGGTHAWGPERVGEHVLLAGQSGDLLCFDAAAQLRWRVALPNTPLAGAAVLDDGQFLLATAAGTLWRIEPSEGREVARVELRRPLSTAPVPVGREVLVGGRCGSLYRVHVPEASASPLPHESEVPQ